MKCTSVASLLLVVMGMGVGTNCFADIAIDLTLASNYTGVKPDGMTTMG